LSGIGFPYSLPESSGPLRQGEILASVSEYLVTPMGALGARPGDPVTTTVKQHPFAVVLTQDCDLAQDFVGRSSEGDRSHNLLIQNVLLCQIDLAENMKNGGSIARGSDIWKRITQNKDERYQFLRAVPPEFDALNVGVGPLLCDLKRIFTLPTELLYRELSDGSAVRRTVMVSPYMEHLCSRHASFLSRVALPLNHHDDIAPMQSPT
jgi:hypothetical protein